MTLGPTTITCPVYLPATTAPVRRAGPDAARVNRNDRKHWDRADSLAPVSQLTPAVRKRVRDKTRYECQNNTYAAGAVRTLVNDTVGRGGRLQLLTDDDKLNAAVEALWREWAAAADWGLTSRLTCGVELVGGECFGVPRESKRLKRLGVPVELDLRLIEPDQVSHGVDFNWQNNNAKGDDGVVCDADGEVVAYKILRTHPGDMRSFSGQAWEADTVSADDVFQWYQPTRPGQLRGITRLMPALPIFAQLRRFTQATLTSAEIAAYLSGVLELPESMNPPAMQDGGITAETMDTFELVQGMLVTVPGGGKVSQFRPEQPHTGSDAFVAAKLREIGRAINMPYGRIAGTFVEHTYSGGRMEEELYWGEREIERQALEAKFFNPFVRRWLDFARFVIPALATFAGSLNRVPFGWQYDPRPSSDPVKDATGDELNLTNGTDTLSDIAAREGLTVEELIAKRKRDIEAWKAAGLPLAPWMVGTPAVARPGDGQPQNPADAKSEAAHVA
jgi:lambda family phage portal protein